MRDQHDLLDVAVVAIAGAGELFHRHVVVVSHADAEDRAERTFRPLHTSPGFSPCARALVPMIRTVV